jgi:hypothetical protein
MSRAGLEGGGWWLALAGDGELPALLDPSDGLGRVKAEPLQHHEGDQDQGDVADHRGVGEALAGTQPGVLLGVTEDGLHLPAALLAHHDGGKVRGRVAGDEVVVVAVTVLVTTSRTIPCVGV